MTKTAITPRPRPLLWFAVWAVAALAIEGVSRLATTALPRLPSGMTVLDLAAILAAILAAAYLLKAVTLWWLVRRRKPVAEGVMVGRLYMLCAVFGILLAVTYGLGKLNAFGQFFALFGGMLLGWSLQAPVSGFAAYILVSMKRPFRPGDRVQFPSLALVGDVKDIGAMYTVLDQVGGTIGSEEAVGRYILVPNAMLFTQVVINYTVKQEAAYMLDEVVIRITYDSNWDKAEEILRGAAVAETADIIAASGVQPYVRSDWYDYGVYLRLRFQTRVQDRVDISYRIQKRIFEEVQRTPTVDMAIPYVYSYRAGLDRKEDDLPDEERTRRVQTLPLDQIHVVGGPTLDPADVQDLARGIRSQGLLQPVVVTPLSDGSGYELLAGHLRLAACRSLGWKAVPAVIRHHQSSPPDSPDAAG